MDSTRNLYRMIHYFSSLDLRELCFMLHVDYEDLPGSFTLDKARALIEYMQREGRKLELIEAIVTLHPNVVIDLVLRGDREQFFHQLPRVLCREFTDNDWWGLWARFERGYSLLEIPWFIDKFGRRLPRHFDLRYPCREYIRQLIYELERDDQITPFIEAIIKVRPDVLATLFDDVLATLFDEDILIPPPPPLAVPPPPFGRRWLSFCLLYLAGAMLVWMVVTLLGLGLGVSPQSTSSITTSGSEENTKYLFAVQMILLTGSIAIAPTIAYHLTKQWGRIARIVVETILFTVILLAFSWWQFGANAFGVWITYAVGLILLLELGSHLIERHQINILERLSRSEFAQSLEDKAKTIERTFRSELALYIPIPICLLIGTAVGLIRQEPSLQIVSFSVQSIFWTVAVALILFLITTFIRMVDPLFETKSVQTAHVASEQIQSPFTKRLIGIIIKLFVPSPRPDVKNQEQKDLDMAYIATDLRKVYLYDAAHNVALLVASIVIAVSFWGLTFDIALVIASVIALFILLCQLPFILGQRELHEKILERYEGQKRLEMDEKLRKVAPLTSNSEVLKALSISGLAGSSLYFLLIGVFVRRPSSPTATTFPLEHIPQGVILMDVFLNSISSVTGPLTLIAFLAVIVLAMFRRSVDDKKGLQYVYNLFNNKLTKDQFYDVSKLIIDRVFWAVLIIFTFLILAYIGSLMLGATGT